jgi:predicted O-linked N-acetylglucosamine transferase (SPINDLY family)
LSLLKSEQTNGVDFELLIQVLKNVLDRAPFYPSSFDFTEASTAHVKDPVTFLNLLIPFVYKISFSAKQVELAARFTELALRVSPKQPELLAALSIFYQDSSEYTKGIETAKLCYLATESISR